MRYLLSKKVSKIREDVLGYCNCYGACDGDCLAMCAPGCGGCTSECGGTCYAQCADGCGGEYDMW